MASVFTERATGTRTYTRADGTVATYARESRARLVMKLTLPNRTRRRVAIQFDTEGQARELLAAARGLEDLTHRTRELTPEHLAPYEQIGLLSSRTHQLLTGAPVRHVPQTWDGVLETYLAKWSISDTPKTRQSRTKRAQYVVTRARDLWATPGDATRQGVEAYLKARLAEGRSLSTVTRDLFTLRHLLGEADLHPLDRLRVPGGRMNRYETRINVLTAAQDHALLRTAWRDRRLLGGAVFGAYLLCRFFGLRPSEAQYLTWDDVQADGLSFGKKPITETESSERWSDGQYHTKTRTLRKVHPPHGREVIAILKAHLPRRGRFVLGSGDRVHADVARTLTSLLDHSASPEARKRAPRDDYFRIRARVLKGLSAYSLRHTFATWMLRRARNGEPYERADLVTLMQWMGHVNPRTTMIYGAGEYEEGTPTILEALRALTAPSASKVVPLRRPRPGRPAA